MAEPPNLPPLAALRLQRGPRRRRRWPWVLGALVLGAAALAAFGPRKPEVQVATVQVAYPSQQYNQLSASGYVVAQRRAAVSSKATGRLIELNVREGSVVKKDELLARVDPADVNASLGVSQAGVAQAAAALRQAESNLQLAQVQQAQAEDDLRRTLGLSAQGFVSPQAVEAAQTRAGAAQATSAAAQAAVGTARAAEAQARAQVKVQQVNRDLTEIRAPFDGVVGLRAVSEGALVTPATRIASFQRLDRLKVDFSVPEKYAYRLDPAGAVVVTVAGRTAPLAGRIQAIEPLVDPATRTLQVRARCENPGGVLFSGGFVSVRLALTEVPDAILVPALALIPGAGDQVVFVVEDGHARQRVVKTGARTESAVQIVEGLRAGDALIVSGLQTVRPGLAVRVVADEPRSLHAGAAPTGPVAKAALN